MTTSNKEGDSKKLKLKRPGRLELSKTVEQGQVRQSFSHGRSKQVAVEVKRKRTYQRGEGGRMTEVKAEPGEPERAPEAPEPAEPLSETETQILERAEARAGRELTEGERQARLRALETARRDEEDRKRRQAEEEERRRLEAEEEAKRRAEEDERRKAEEEAKRQLEAEEEARRKEKEAKEAGKKAAKPEPEDEAVAGAEASEQAAEPAEAAEPAPEAAPPGEAGAEAESAETAKAPDKKRGAEAEIQEELGGRVKRAKPSTGKPAPTKRTASDRRRGKLTISQALEGEEGDRARSLAAVRRQREREKQRRKGQQAPQKVVREVVIPDAITVGELAQRMAVRGGEVVKALMGMDIMATINQTIDADTAELVVEEFGHKAKRVSESDVEEGLKSAPDREEDLQARAPVVTVMGHVDHGKTSLLDALRRSDVVAGEAGGITQHIGAYQVQLPSSSRITFIDTPGHAAFTEMRSRGATVTDIVVLVVAADDSVMDQTVEAINHAKAAEVPIIVAINKCDRPDANPDRVRQELLNYEVITEEMGGETLAVEVSATTGDGLDKLEEAILLQAELLELKANPDRPAEGTVIEAKLEKGRGPVATVLVKRGTLRQGDTFVAGSEWGRARALVNDRGAQVKEAGPGVPVEVLGLQGAPRAGDEFVVVESEQRAREISEYRREKERQKEIAASDRGSLEQMLSKVKEGERKELPLVVKADVQGSLEAITGALNRLGNEEVQPQILHGGVGGISESDVSLAGASDAIIIAFNVRANAKAREVAKRDGVDIRYYSVIYNVIDDVKAGLEGMLSPVTQESFIGYAEIRQVFSISKVGKVAGCRVTEGVVKRGAGVRLLRDNVVIYEGRLKTLKRFKDEVKEVKEGYECGIALENFDNIEEGDVLECYETQEVSRVLS